MADNVAITAGTGTTVHADEYTHSTLGSGKTQLVKLVDGTLDSSTAIEAGGGVEAGALRVTLASDSTGVVSIDDNGGTLTVDGTVAVTNADIGTIAGAVAGTEMQVDVVAALPAGTNAIGKLAANSGVDIGDVDVTSVVPGTGATNLGKARGSSVGSTDTGVAALMRYVSADAHTTLSDGQYGLPTVTDFQEIRTRDQRAIDLANCNAYTDYTVLGNDTANLANSTNHVFGTGAITFDKVNGAANTVFAGVYKSFTAINVAEIFEAGGFVGLSAYLSSLSNVVNTFLRIGTDASNYNCWTWAVADLSAGAWMNLRKSAAQPDYSRNAGTGWSTSAIAYVAFGVEFNSEANTLAGILIDHVHIVGGRVTATDITTSISSTVNTPNVNINKIAGTTPDVNNGTVSAGTQRVTIASDSTGQVKLAAGTASIGTLAANSGVDIGDVTLNNATLAVTQSGTWDEVGINDSGNSITVDNGGTFAVQAASTVADGANVTLGAKADAKSTATDTTAISAMSVLKQISASVQAPPSQAVTNAGTFAVQATLGAETTKVIGTVNVAASQTIGVTQATAGNLNCTEASGAAIKTAVEALDNSVDGNYLNTNLNYAGTDAATGNGTAAGSLRVSLASDSTGIVSLTTSTASIGKLAANSGVDIGDVTLTAGTAAIGTILPTDIDITAHANYARKYYTSAGAATDGIIWSPAAGKRWHVTSLYFQTSADATITFEDDKSGGDDPVLKGEYKAGSGVALTFDERYPFASGEDAADLMVTTSAGNIYVSVVGYEI